MSGKTLSGGQDATFDNVTVNSSLILSSITDTVAGLTVRAMSTAQRTALIDVPDGTIIFNTTLNRMEVFSLVNGWHTYVSSVDIGNFVQLLVATQPLTANTVDNVATIALQFSDGLVTDGLGKLTLNPDGTTLGLDGVTHKLKGLYTAGADMAITGNVITAPGKQTLHANLTSLCDADPDLPLSFRVHGAGGGTLSFTDAADINTFGKIIADTAHAIYIRADRAGITSKLTHYSFGSHEFWTNGLLGSQTKKLTIEQAGIVRAENDLYMNSTKKVATEEYVTSAITGGNLIINGTLPVQANKVGNTVTVSLLTATPIVLNGSNALTVSYDDVTIGKNGSGQLIGKYLAGTGLTLSSATFNIDVDNNTLVVNGLDQLTGNYQGTGGISITNNQINLLKTDPLTVNGSGQLTVRTDDVTIGKDVFGQLEAKYLGGNGITIAGASIQVNTDASTLTFSAGKLVGNYTGTNGVQVTGNSISGNYAGAAGITVTGNSISGTELQTQITEAQTVAGEAAAAAAAAQATADLAAGSVSALGLTVVGLSIDIGIANSNISGLQSDVSSLQSSLGGKQTAHANLTSLCDADPDLPLSLRVHGAGGGVLSFTDAGDVNTRGRVQANDDYASYYRSDRSGQTTKNTHYSSGSHEFWTNGVLGSQTKKLTIEQAGDARFSNDVYANNTALLATQAYVDSVLAGGSTAYQPIHANLTALSDGDPDLPTSLKVHGVGGGTLSFVDVADANTYGKLVADPNHAIYIRGNTTGIGSKLSYYSFGTHDFYTNGAIGSQSKRLAIEQDGTGRFYGPVIANGTDTLATTTQVDGKQTLHANLTSLSDGDPDLPALRVHAAGGGSLSFADALDANTFGKVFADTAHATYYRSDRSGTALSKITHYSFGSHEFWTNGALGSQTKKFTIEQGGTARFTNSVFANDTEQLATQTYVDTAVATGGGSFQPLDSNLTGLSGATPSITNKQLLMVGDTTNTKIMIQRSNTTQAVGMEINNASAPSDHFFIGRDGPGQVNLVAGRPLISTDQALQIHTSGTATLMDGHLQVSHPTADTIVEAMHGFFRVETATTASKIFEVYPPFPEGPATFDLQLNSVNPSVGNIDYRWTMVNNSTSYPDFMTFRAGNVVLANNLSAGGTLTSNSTIYAETNKPVATQDWVTNTYNDPDIQRFFFSRTLPLVGVTDSIDISTDPVFDEWQSSMVISIDGCMRARTSANPIAPTSVRRLGDGWNVTMDSTYSAPDLTQVLNVINTSTTQPHASGYNWICEIIITYDKNTSRGFGTPIPL